jgi:hypothetical protein
VMTGGSLLAAGSMGGCILSGLGDALTR